jgi:hypothetical protein
VTDGVKRKAEAQPVIDKLYAWLAAEWPKVDNETPIAKAMNYIVNHQVPLTRFLDNGLLRLDNNLSELELRRQKVGAHNWLFCGSDDGAHWNATAVSLIASCQFHGIEPWVEVAGEMEVQGLRRNHLRAAAARGAALEAEHRAERGLAERCHRARPEAAQRVHEPDGGGGLSFTLRCRGDGGDNDELSARPAGEPLQGRRFDLRDVGSVWLDFGGEEPRLFGDGGDGPELRSLGDLERAAHAREVSAFALTAERCKLVLVRTPR